MSTKTIQELQVALAKINKELYKLRKQRVLSSLAKLRKEHGLTRHIKARETCFEAAEAQGRHDVALREIEELETLLDIEY